jgi:hypothetical protein
MLLWNRQQVTGTLKKVLIQKREKSEEKNGENI